MLAHESRHVAEEESRRQTDLLMREIEAHERTDAKLQQAKENAEAASQAKSRYLVGLSHELRNPLNSIFGYSQILERDSTIPARRKDAVQVVRRSAEHLSGLIDGLLDISKIEAGRFQLDRQEVRIARVSRPAGRHVSAAGRHQRHRLPLPPGSRRCPTVVYTDENRLRQVLINLLSNAIKFTDRGHVTLQIKYRNQVAELRRSRIPASASIPRTSIACSSRSSAPAAVRRAQRPAPGSA